MPRPYSLDLRERVVASFVGGRGLRATAALFGVSASSVSKWAERKRRTGSVAPAKMGGHRPFAAARERDWILARIAEKPDLTLCKLLAELHARGLKISYFGLWNFLRHEGISFKKKPARQRAAAARRRAAAAALDWAPEAV
jgi:transposase